MPDPPPPTRKCFDNLYFVGRGSVSAWAIKTSAGIILIDTLDNPKEADDFIIAGLKKLRTWIRLPHQIHRRHPWPWRPLWRRSVELQHKIPGARVLMSALDYDLWRKKRGHPGRTVPGHACAQALDLVVTDGQTADLGR